MGMFTMRTEKRLNNPSEISNVKNLRGIADKMQLEKKTHCTEFDFLKKKGCNQCAWNCEETKNSDKIKHFLTN